MYRTVSSRTKVEGQRPRSRSDLRELRGREKMYHVVWSAATSAHGGELKAELLAQEAVDYEVTG